VAATGEPALNQSSIAPLAIPESIITEMVAHCRDQAPQEACGILAGIGSEVSRLYLMDNLDHSPVSYAMDPSEQFRVMKDMRVRQVSMLGIFHSHPTTPAFPSQKDISLAFYDDCCYVIVSLAEEPPAVKAFSISEGLVREVPLLIVAPGS
jgi:proteasome lid subunit RPN8/RPN11